VRLRIVFILRSTVVAERNASDLKTPPPGCPEPFLERQIQAPSKSRVTVKSSSCNLRLLTCIRPRIRTGKRDARCMEFVGALDDPNWSLTRRDDFIDRLLPGTEGRPVLSRGGTRYLASASSTATHLSCGCSVRSTVPSAFCAKLLTN
jgi:hypothetical protein